MSQNHPVKALQAPPEADHPAGKRAADLSALGLLSEPTRRRLYEYVISRPDEIGRDEAAAALGISRELTAFHLDRLTRAGLLKATYRRLSGRTGPGAGRPAKHYARSEREIAVSLPARRYEVPAETFADALERLGHELGGERVAESVASVARDRGCQVGLRARRAAGPRARPNRRRGALLDQLAEAGFAPLVNPTTGEITLRNCPYDAVAREHRDLTCGMNKAWAEGVVDALGDGQTTVELAPGSGRCCVVLRPDELPGQ